VQTDDEHIRTVLAIAGHIKEVDLVITTANIPGRKSPRLITEATVRTMRPGSVIIDLAAENGGNCELTRAGETVHAHGVTIIGPVNLPSTVPYHASQMFGRNVLALLQHLVNKEGALVIDPTDEITGAMLVTHDGRVLR
jgi:NAD(P) transhydrogenase subunit alpha